LVVIDVPLTVFTKRLDLQHCKTVFVTNGKNPVGTVTVVAVLLYGVDPLINLTSDTYPFRDPPEAFPKLPAIKQGLAEVGHVAT